MMISWNELVRNIEEKSVMFNDSKLNEVFEEVRPFMEGNKEAMNNISSDILNLERYIAKNVTLPASFCMEISDMDYLMFCTNLKRFKYCLKNGDDKLVMECKFPIRRLVHGILPDFLRNLSDSLPQANEAIDNGFCTSVRD